MPETRAEPDEKLHALNRLAHEVAKASVNLLRRRRDLHKCRPGSKQASNASEQILYASQALERHALAYGRAREKADG